MSIQDNGTAGRLTIRELTVRELTLGNGVSKFSTPIIVLTTSQLRTNQAPAAFSFTPPASAGTYRVSFYLDITVGTTLTFIAKLTYTDPAGSARSANVQLVLEGGTAVLAGGPAANSTGQFTGEQSFGIDNSATAITVVDNSGTYTTGTYRWIVVLEQLA